MTCSEMYFWSLDQAQPITYALTWIGVAVAFIPAVIENGSKLKLKLSAAVAIFSVSFGLIGSGFLVWSLNRARAGAALRECVNTASQKARLTSDRSMIVPGK